MNGYDWPSLSIIIPSLNQGNFIERAILSILKQNYPGTLQILVMDGGSTDNTIQILKKYPSISWRSEPDDGPADAVNKGLKLADGEIIGVMPSSDFYLKNAFHRMIPYLAANSAIDLVCGAIVFIKKNKNKKLIQFYKKSYKIIESPELYILDKMPLPMQGMFIRRTACSRAGMLITTSICNDLDYIYKILHFSKGLLLPYYVCAYEYHEQSKTGDSADSWINDTKLAIEGCERNPVYGRIFKLTHTQKTELFLKKQILWYGRVPGTEEYKNAQKTAKNILHNKSRYSSDLVQNAADFLAAGENWMNKIFISIRYGRFISKIHRLIKNTLLSQIYKRTIDLEWYREY